ncbi:MAG: TRAP transporter small permease subunit, partial [Henriciella sp.]
MASLIDIIGTGLTWLGLALLPFILWPLLVLILPRLLNRIAGRLIKWQDALSDIMISVAASLAFIIILIQLLSVLLRYVFGLSFSWLTDSIIFSFASIFMLGAAGTLKSDGHVRVDIFYLRMSERGKAWVDLFGNLAFMIPVCAIIIWF